MSQTVSEFARVYVLNALWQAPLLALAGECAGRLMRPMRASVVHRFWVACLLMAVLLPVAPLLRRVQTHRVAAEPAPTASLPATHRQGQPSAGPILSLADGPQLSFAGTAPPVAPYAKHWGTWTSLAVPALGIVYLLSVLFALAKLIWGVCRTVALLRGTVPAVLTDDLELVWTACCDRLQLTNVRLLSSGRLASPATLTLRTPVVLLPHCLSGQDATELAAAFCHELAHVRRHDFLKNLVYEALAAPLFFHPATHWMRRQVQETRELACDDLAAEVLHGRSAYASCLVRLAERISATPATPGRALGVFEGNVLEKRIMNLIETKTEQTGWRVGCSAACGVALIAASCVAGTRLGLQPVFAGSAPSAPATVAIKPASNAMPAPSERATARALPVPESVDDANDPDPASDVPAPAANGLVAAELSRASATDPEQAAPTETPANDMDLKPVAFKIGETYFKPGDAITIDEIRGTSDKIEEANLYQIKGRYTLNSQDSAELAANVTTSGPMKEYPGLAVQHTIVQHGDGHFSLWIYTRNPGKPHLSFYPTKGGSSFAGVYFETASGGSASASPAAAIPQSEVPRGWVLAGSKPDKYVTGVDRSVTHAEQPSAYLAATARDPGGFGTLSQYFKANDYLGKRVRLHAWVRSKDVSSWAGLWMRVDQAEKSVAFDNMQDRSIKGTSDWKPYDVVLDVPKTSTDIALGILLDGPGEVWLSGVKVEVVGKEVASTDMKSGTATPAGPINLGFDKE